MFKESLFEVYCYSDLNKSICDGKFSLNIISASLFKMQQTLKNEWIIK